MPKFKIGDRVRRFKTPFRNFRVGTEGTISEVAVHGRTIRFEGDIQWYSVNGFELVQPEKSLPLTTVLVMDRVIAKAGGSAAVLEEYLDRPLSDFIQFVMMPNGLTLALTK